MSSRRLRKDLAVSAAFSAGQRTWPSAAMGSSFTVRSKRRWRSTASLADISFKPQGYLFLSDGGDSSRMRSNYETQTANGVGAELLEQGDLKKRFPSVNFDDVEIGVLTPDDAWIDPHAAMMGFRRMARHLGVDYRKDRVVDWQGDGAAARHVTLESGQIISAKTFVLAAGAWSGEIAAMLDWHVPIRPMSRQTHYFLCKAEIEPLPFLKCETDLAFRPEGPVLRAVSLIGPSVPVSIGTMRPIGSRTKSGRPWRIGYRHWKKSASSGHGPVITNGMNSTRTPSSDVGAAVWKTSISRAGFPVMASCRHPVPAVPCRS